MKKRPLPQSLQFVAGFIIPTINLLTLSDESKLGPLWGMALSLVFPVALELYAFVTGRKASVISLFAIIGILLIGAISLFGLSEEWLAARRAAIYIIAGIAVLGVVRFKRDWVDTGLGFVFDMDKVRATAKSEDSRRTLHRVVTYSAYAFASSLLAVGIWSYVFTILFMNAPTGSSAFNAQYAELRLLSLPAVTLPFLILVMATLMYLLSRIEKHTGLEPENLLKKR
jgi:hypothetical protein